MAKVKRGADVMALMSQYALDIPKYWENWPRQKRLDWIGERILAKSRTTHSYTEMKEEGWLTSGQYSQRKMREVLYTFSEDEEYYDVPTRGVFSRRTEDLVPPPLGEYYPKKSNSEFRVEIQRH